MKQIRYIGGWLLMMLAMGGCSKQGFDSFPMEKSFEDPSIAMEKYQQALMEADAGWEFGLMGRESGLFTGFLDFSAGSHARFSAGIHDEVSLQDTPFEIGLRSTYAVLSFPSGAFASFAANQTDIDTVFAFKSLLNDTLYLRGDQYGNELKLVRTTNHKAEAYREARFLEVQKSLDNLARLPYYFKRLTINGADYDLCFRPDLDYLYIFYGGTERFSVHETPYSITATGIYLQHPLIDGINQIDYLDDFHVDEEGTAMATKVGGLRVNFTNQPDPSSYDLEAAVRFFTNPPHQMVDQMGLTQRYSASWNAFTVAGEEDAFGFGEIPDYRFTVFFHQWTGQEYGLIHLAIQSGNSNLLTSYGLAFRPLFSNPPMFIGFDYYGVLGSIPANVESKFQALATTISNPSGYMVVKSGPSSYDLVSRDLTGGQNWIRFE